MEMSHMAPRKLLVTSCWSWYLCVWGGGHKGVSQLGIGLGQHLGTVGSAGTGDGPNRDRAWGSSCIVQSKGDEDERCGGTPQTHSDCTISVTKYQRGKKKQQPNNPSSEGFCFRSELSLRRGPPPPPPPRCHVADGRNRCGALGGWGGGGVQRGAPHPPWTRGVGTHRSQSQRAQG